MFNNILLAADGSFHSYRAAEKAIELAKFVPHSYIEIVYVIDLNASKADVLNYSNPIQIEQKRREKVEFIEKLAKKHGVRYVIKILRGEPGPSIVKYCNENQFNLVIIGSRGLNVMQEMVLGSVSHNVAKRANCPVMIVK
ncbi:universal stress protein [Niallia sp. Krafla_26]|uniref:universal stress protein n=1 Tax=Niallia sp. Krafla_26 TaxID=3064703 RepID=UPI003D172F58